MLRICAVARELGLATFLDGARLWNASAASGLSLHELAAPFDLVAVAFSKGLGAPGGSLLAGLDGADRDGRTGTAVAWAGRCARTASSRRRRCMRWTITWQRLPEDHANARVLAEALAAAAPVQLDLATVQTNIVVFHLPATLAIDAPTLSSQARDRGVLVNAFGPRTVRAVTHLDVTRAQCALAAAVLGELLSR